jgi:hypothetical protein
MAPPSQIPRNVATKTKTYDFLLTTWVVTTLNAEKQRAGKK